jgi:hypothetical protein
MELGTMPQYVVDKFYVEAEDPQGFRVDSERLTASGDQEAIEEAKHAASWQKPSHFMLRRAFHGAYSIIYRSPDSQAARQIPQA